MPDPAAGRTLRYRVGNEHSPTDPWGRSELVIHPDGTARLDHFFSRPGPTGPAGPAGSTGSTGSWTGRVEPAALETLWAELTRAGFPSVPPGQPLPPDSTIRTLTVQTEGRSETAYLSWHQSPALPGYAEAFDVIDAVIRQLSRDAIKYPTKQHQIVSEITACEPGK